MTGAIVAAVIVGFAVPQIGLIGAPLPKGRYEVLPWLVLTLLSVAACIALVTVPPALGWWK
jgi:hypothetical protein